MKYLYVVGQGIGNIVETVYTFMQLREYYNNEIDVCYNHRTGIDGSTEKADFYRVITDYYGLELHISHDYKLPEETAKKYEGQITSVWVQPISGIPVIVQPSGTWTNEIVRNNSVLRKLGIQEDPQAGLDVFKLEWLKMRGREPEAVPKYEIILNNGGYNTQKWLRKRYKYWNDISIALASKYVTGAVGRPDEAIKCADDLTYLPLIETMDVIANCDYFLGNDSGLYHFASACGIPGIVMFTATNINKNWHPGFHMSMEPLHTRLKCQPCQEDTWGWSPAFHRCNDYKCCEYEPEMFLRFIEAGIGRK